MTSGETKAVDVDGSYLFRKHQQLTCVGVDLPQPGLPDIPLVGWEQVNAGNHVDNAKKIPRVTPGKCRDLSSVLLAFNAVSSLVLVTHRFTVHLPSRGGWKLNWERSFLSTPEGVHALVVSSMYVHLPVTVTAFVYVKSVVYFSNRKSATCTHVSGLLHALVSLSPSEFQLPGSETTTAAPGDAEVLPITSYACQWKVPRKRKDSTMLMSDASFHKHVYGRERKRSLKPLEDFDPRPVEYRATATDRLPELLDKLRGKGLCVSLTLDPKTRCWSETDSSSVEPLPPRLPSKKELQERVAEFKKSLNLSPEKCREIEFKTRDQSRSSLWYSVRRYRITASYFGHIHRRLPTTPPQSLVLQILGTSSFSSPVTEWGRKNEPIALEQYTQHHRASGHNGLYACSSGFVISEEHPFLGASPDAAVYDPSHIQPFGLAEVKCPYSCRQITPVEACSRPNFCCTLSMNGNVPGLKLRKEHLY